MKIVLMLEIETGDSSLFTSYEVVKNAIADCLDIEGLDITVGQHICPAKEKPSDDAAYGFGL